MRIRKIGHRVQPIAPVTGAAKVGQGPKKPQVIKKKKPQEKPGKRPLEDGKGGIVDVMA